MDIQTEISNGLMTITINRPERKNSFTNAMYTALADAFRDATHSSGVKVVLLFVNWKCAVLFVLIPHQYAAWGIVGTNYFQHDGCDQEHPCNHSRNFKGKLLNYLLFNNGYHGAHHMKPNLHWSLVPAYHREHLEPNIHPSLNRESLLAYLIEAHIYPAKRLDYLGNPVVLAPATADVDWVKEVNVGAHKEDMAA